jgi:Flp pilus assembly protein TadB
MADNIKDMTAGVLSDELLSRIELGTVQLADLEKLDKAIGEKLMTSQRHQRDHTRMLAKNLRTGATFVFVALVVLLIVVAVWTFASYEIGLIVQAVGVLCLTVLLLGFLRALDRLIDRH